MAISDGDLVQYLTGGTANTVKNDSIGGQISNTILSRQDNIIPTLFDEVDHIKSTRGYSDYRCIAIKNIHQTLSMYNTRVRIKTRTTSPSTHVELGVDPVGVVIPSSTKKAVSIQDSETAPLGVTFEQPTALDYSALLLGTIPPGHVAFLWIKWVGVAESKAQDIDLLGLTYFAGSKE